MKKGRGIKRRGGNEGKTKGRKRLVRKRSNEGQKEVMKGKKRRVKEKERGGRGKR